jgi:hypothetical protein
MYFIRDGSASLSIGQLLERKAAEGVRIKVLGWDMDVMGFNPWFGREANLPGRLVWPTAIRTKRLDDTRAYSQEGRFTSTDAQYAYDRYWFGLYMDKPDNVPIHPRYQNHPGVSQQQQHCNGNKMPLALSWPWVFPLERLEILWRMRYRNLMPASVTSAMLNAAFPTHHQKCAGGLWPPERAIGFVMGHNMLDEYWDTEAHPVVPPPRIGAVTEPIHARISPPWSAARAVLSAQEFCRGLARCHRRGPGATPPARPPARLPREDNAQRCALLRRDQGQVTKAQILRTQSQKRPGYCRPLHPHAEKRHPPGVCGKPVFPLAALDEIKKVAARLAAAGADPGKYGNLNLFVITNSSDEGVGAGILNTYKLLDSLGRADTIPNVARSQEIDWRRQQLQEAKATQAKLESQLNRSAAHYPRVSPGHEELLKQVNEAREAVPKARRRSAPARWHVKRPKNHQQQAIRRRHSRPQHSCVQPGGPGLPGYQPDVYRPTPANPRQSLAMRYDPQADAPAS